MIFALKLSTQNGRKIEGLALVPHLSPNPCPLLWIFAFCSTKGTEYNSLSLDLGFSHMIAVNGAGACQLEAMAFHGLGWFCPHLCHCCKKAPAWHPRRVDMNNDKSPKFHQLHVSVRRPSDKLEQGY